MTNTDNLSNEARAKIEQYADTHGTEVPPIPHITFDGPATSDEARLRVEKIDRKK